MPGWTRVAAVGDVAPGALLAVEVEGHDICVARTEEGELYALQNNCTHKDYPLSEGELDDDQLECSWHGAKFDVRSGRALCLPAVKPVRTYEVKVEGDDILVEL